MSGSWINLKNLDSVNREELTRVFQIMQVSYKIDFPEFQWCFLETEKLSDFWQPQLSVQQPGNSASTHLSDDYEQREHHGKPQVLWSASLLWRKWWKNCIEVCSAPEGLRKVWYIVIIVHIKTFYVAALLHWRSSIEWSMTACRLASMVPSTGWLRPSLSHHRPKKL